MFNNGTGWASTLPNIRLFSLKRFCQGGHVLFDMYLNVKCAVKITNLSISNFFYSLSGVKQGCVLSPLLFSLFVVELENMMYEANVRGIFVG